MITASVTPMTAQLSQPNWPEFKVTYGQPSPQPSGMNTDMKSVLETIRFQAAEIEKLRKENKRIKGCLRSLDRQLKTEKLRSESRRAALQDLKESLTCNS